MADLRDPQSYNIWDKERWSKKARMETADRAEENAFKREADLRTKLQDMINSGALGRLMKSHELVQQAEDAATTREFNKEEKKFTTELGRKARAFGLLPRVLSGEDISPEESAVLADHAPGFSNLNRARAAIGGSPQALDFGRRAMAQDVAEAEAGAGEARIRREAATTALPLTATKTLSEMNRMISGSTLADAENTMRLKDLERSRKLDVDKTQAEIDALRALAKQREAKVGGEDPLAALGVKKPQPPARIPGGMWNDETTNVTPGR